MPADPRLLALPALRRHAEREADPTTPTAEQIAAMEARGWTWEPCEGLHVGGTFVAAAGKMLDGQAIIRMRVVLYSRKWPEDAGRWGALYGTPGVGFDRLARWPTPELAADEAEAWLRDVLAQFRFPWLRLGAV